MRFIHVRLLSALLIVFVLSCSNAEKDYSKVQQLQDSKAQLLQQDMDYDVKLQACDAVIAALHDFISKHEKGQWHDAAGLSLGDWQKKRNHVIEEQAYAKLQTTLSSSEQIMSNTYDYDIKMSSCDDAINGIQEFTGGYLDSEFGPSLQKTLVSWQQRKSACQEELNSLIGKFSRISQDKAIEMANVQHMMSNVENLELASRDNKKSGNKIIINDIYDVRMRGVILGTSIFKFKVYVNGYIAMDSKTAGVYNDAYVEE